MNGFRFNDLKRETEVGVYFSEVFCAFTEARGDIEVTFSPEDGCAFVALLEEILTPSQSSTSGVHEIPLVHRFRNLDGDEDAAFLVRECAGGIEMTLLSGIEFPQDLSSLDEGGTSVCISKADARIFADAWLPRPFRSP